MAEHLIGSEILKVATEIRAMLAEGKQICNLTVGDFSPKQFRIPKFLEEEITKAIREGETNYPPPDGVPELRKAVTALYEEWLGLKYPLESVLITAGSRPSIFAIYEAVVDPGDAVVFPVPTYNNNHYCHLVGAKPVPVECHSDSSFLPTRSQLETVIHGARLLCVNSPLNPAGTAFGRQALLDICDMVLEENARRKSNERPLYMMYDQVYWMLTFGTTEHFNPVSLRPEIAPYVFFVDGVSKPFAATGIRVGWMLGPPDIIARMMSINGHVGTWAPRAEQVAVAKLLLAKDEMIAYNREIKGGIQQRLDLLRDSLNRLKSEGFPVDSTPPMGAIYLSARFDVIGRKTPSGEILESNEDIRKYLLHDAGLAIVPFQAFGVTENSGWFRLSIGAVSVNDIETAIPRLRASLQKLS
jgi:aspartate aminotransferase